MYTIKYASRYEILKRRGKKKKKTDWISNRVLNKFVISNKQNIDDNLGKKTHKWIINSSKRIILLEENKNIIDVSNSINCYKYLWL